MWEDILKGNIAKADEQIEWGPVEVDTTTVTNMPDELKNNIDLKDGHGEFDSVESSATVKWIKGAFYVDIKTNGIKAIYSTASEMYIVLTFEDTESNLHEEIESNWGSYMARFVVI